MFTITLHGELLTIRQLENLGQNAVFPRAALNEIVEDMRRISRIQFESEGRRGGGSWRQLEPATIRRKAARGRDIGILRETEKLFNSLTLPHSRNQDVQISPDGIRFGSKLEYADTHHFGDEDRGIPARPLFTVVDGDVRRWERILERGMERAFGNV